MCDELVLEEYKYVISEKIMQYKRQDLTTGSLLTLGGAILAFAKNAGIDHTFVYIFALIIFLYLYSNFIVKRLLALKADAYLRVFFEEGETKVFWFTGKYDFILGVIYRVHRHLVNFLYVGFVALSIYRIHEKSGEYIVTALSGLFAIIIISIGMYYYYKSPYESYLKAWRVKKEALRGEKKQQKAKK